MDIVARLGETSALLVEESREEGGIWKESVIETVAIEFDVFE